ncbi:hypothetical protein PH4a_13820 [Proteus hauseri]|nr:hypothetical protein PH4a_13820 [Proteus hauseri]
MNNMANTLFFGNGLNRLSQNHVTWSDLLDKIKGVNTFQSGQLPNTMVYERILMEKRTPSSNDRKDELEIKNIIANELQLQGSNEILEKLASLPIEHYLTTNYDYAFEKALGLSPNKNNSEDIYSLRRKRKYETKNGNKYLWNIHGEIDNPKSIMLRLDHYCGSVSKLDAYIKGKYKITTDGKERTIEKITKKLEKSSFCLTSWVDLFFCTNIHIIGFSLDYSETDIWWLLNKRARFSSTGNVENKIYFYTHNMCTEKEELLKSFNVKVVNLQLKNNDYKNMYKSAIKEMNIKIN